MRDAAKMTETGSRLAESALADFRRHFAQDPDCAEERRKANEHERVPIWME